MKIKLIALAFALASLAEAQGSFGGLGVLSNGSSDIGAHSGEQLDLRFYAGVDGIYDTGIQPFSLTPNGKLVQVNGLAGVEGTVGAYGVHTWRRAQLRLDYHGDFRHYQGSSQYDGSDQSLQLAYSYQPTRKFTFDMRLAGGTATFALGGPATVYAPVTDSVVAQPTLLLFDNRTYYLQSGLDANFLVTPRTTVSVGGSGYFVDYKAPGLVNVEGYSMHGSFLHKVSRDTGIGADYVHQHFDYPGNFGASDINVYDGRVTRDFGRRWSASLAAGVFTAQVQGLQSVSFDPVVSALLGVPSGVQAFSRKDLYPSGDARVTRRFKTAQIVAAYTVGISPGNGVYLTSRTSNGSGTVSYTGVRKWSFSLGANYGTLSTIGQGIHPYSQKSGSASASYQIMRTLYASTRFDLRDQAVDINGYLRSSYRASVGLSFSPGNIPLSLW